MRPVPLAISVPAALAALAGSAFAVSAPAVAQPGFALERASVMPRVALFDSGRRVRIVFRFAGAGPTDLTIRIRRRGRTLRTLGVPAAEPGRVHRRRWGGLRPSGRLAPEGGYKVWIGPSGERAVEVGRFRLFRHAYPAPGRHGSRGAVGEFGAARSGGRIHAGYDVLADCGARLVAARGGRVVRRGYDPVLYGNHLLIAGRRERRTYFYSHLIRPASVGLRERVRTGQTVGFVGRTGNARSTPCHLHFELRRRGRPIDPLPHLRRWDRWS